MKKSLLYTVLLGCFVALSTPLFGQWKTDTIFMEPGFHTQVFYRLGVGEVGKSPVRNWDLAITNSSRDNGIRVNHVNGLDVYTMTNGDTGSWKTFDTTGWMNLRPMYNSTENLDLGAFNQSFNTSDPWDFSWGRYNLSTHTVIGDSLYLLVRKDGSGRVLSYKKLWLIKQGGNGDLHLRFANIDGSDEHLDTIKVTGADHNFSYYNLQTKKQVMREPNKKDWDLTFTRWMQYLGPHSPISHYPSTGVHTNYGTYVAKVEGMHHDDVREWTLRPQSVNSHFIVGTNWKYQGQNHQTLLQDSLSYGVYSDSLANRGHLFYFSKYEGSSTGKIIINYKEGAYLDLAEVKKAELNIYPNPVVNGELTIALNANESLRKLDIIGLNGQVIRTYHSFPNGKGLLNVKDLKPGVYFVKVATNESSVTRKIIVNN